MLVLLLSCAKLQANETERVGEESGNAHFGTVRKAPSTSQLQILDRKRIGDGIRLGVGGTRQFRTHPQHSAFDLVAGRPMGYNMDSSVPSSNEIPVELVSFEGELVNREGTEYQGHVSNAVHILPNELSEIEQDDGIRVEQSVDSTEEFNEYQASAHMNEGSSVPPTENSPSGGVPSTAGLADLTSSPTTSIPIAYLALSGIFGVFAGVMASRHKKHSTDSSNRAQLQLPIFHASDVVGGSPPPLIKTPFFEKSADTSSSPHMYVIDANPAVEIDMSSYITTDAVEHQQENVDSYMPIDVGH